VRKWIAALARLTRRTTDTDFCFFSMDSEEVAAFPLIPECYNNQQTLTARKNKNRRLHKSKNRGELARA
jgi:hypothetical protein